MRALLRDAEDQALIALEVEPIMRSQESCGPMPIP